jgi:hypothetical protein
MRRPHAERRTDKPFASFVACAFVFVFASAGAGCAGSTAGATIPGSSIAGLARTWKPNSLSLRADTIIRTMLLGTISSSATCSPSAVWPSRVNSMKEPPVSTSRQGMCGPIGPSCR